jgi:Uma2 family endonuclease
MTRADLDQLPDDGRRYELIDGVLVVSPSPTWLHQRAAFRLARLLDDACSEDLEVFTAPLDVDIADDTRLQPDILIVRRDRLGERSLSGLPELAVEVLSPSTRRFDLVLKRSRYEEAGCPGYWVVDPEGPSIVAWELVDGRYVESGRADGDAELVLTRPYHVVVNPARLTD